MASMILSGDTSGTVTLSAPLVAGSNTATLPAATGTVALTSDIIGIGQTWTDVRASRASGTTYTNSTGKPIQVFVSVTSTTNGNGNLNTSTAVVSGTTISTIETSESSGFYRLPSVHSFIVPNSGTYSITNTAGVGNVMTITSWTELR